MKRRWKIATTGALVTVLAPVVTAVALGYHSLLHTPPPLPEFPHPTVDHPGVYPSPAQEMMQPVVIRVDASHHREMLNAVVNDIENSGGRVEPPWWHGKITAVVPAGYLERIGPLMPQQDAWLNPNYVSWTQRAHGDGAAKTTGPWTEIRFEVKKRYTGTRQAGTTIQICALIAAASPALASLWFAAMMVIGDPRDLRKTSRQAE